MDFMDYKRIPIVLKRYGFESKMYICQEYSRQTMSTSGLIGIEKLRQMPLPWDLETFALFSILTNKEYSHKTFENSQGRRQFTKIINSIKNYEHPELKTSPDNKNFLGNFLIVTGLTQFPIQEDIRLKLFRYSYIFNFKNDNINMELKFSERFGCEYKEFMKFGFFIQCLYSVELFKKTNPRIISYILQKYNHVLRHLTIDREEFIALQGNVTREISQYMYGYNYLNQFPFIRCNQQVFFPLPHLIIQSVTTSLLSRLTKGDNDFRSLFGKEVLESYLLYLSNLSNHFDEVKVEYGYNFKRNERRTLDIMIRKGDQCLMMDSKSMTPKFGLRNLTEKDVEITVNRLVGAIIQIYKHVKLRFQNEYYPFDIKMNFPKQDIFGAVVIYEDSYIHRETIMMKAAKDLGIDLNSQDYDYLCSNIKIFSLYEYEQLMFWDEDVFQLLLKNREERFHWFDFSIIPSNNESKKKLNREIYRVVEDMQDSLVELAENLVGAGLITRN